MRTKWNSFDPIVYQIRSFYAAALAKVPPIPARIEEVDFTVKLLTYAPHPLYQHLNKLASGQLTNPVSEADLTEKTWDVCISSYKPYGLLYTDNGKPQESLITEYGEEYFCSTNYYQELTKDSLGSFAKTYKYNVTKNLDKVLDCQPDQEYAIPKPIWDQFIAKLPYQDVVELLNLATHRHLYLRYNEIIDNTKAQRIQKAELIGKYHFLRNHDIIDGEIVNNLYKEMPQQFLDLFAHCPDGRVLETIYLMLLNPLFTELDIRSKPQINTELRDEFISFLPSSIASPLEFIDMLDKARKILAATESCYISSSPISQNMIKAQAFYEQMHPNNKFGKMSLTGRTIGELQEYAEQITSDLVYPEVMRRAKNISGERASSVFYTLSFGVLKYLVRNNGVAAVQTLQKRWYQNIVTINAAKPDIPNQPEWHALFEPVTIGEVSFTCLSSLKQVIDAEAELHRNVVVGDWDNYYINQYLSGADHIIKVCDNSGNSSILRLTFKGLSMTSVRFDVGIEITHQQFHRSGVVRVIEHTAVRGQKPCDEILNATKLLLAAIEENRIELNEMRGGIAVSGERPVPWYPDEKTRFYRYHFFDHQTQKTIHQAYKDTETIPPQMKESYKELVTAEETKPLIANVVSQIGAKTRTQLFFSNVNYYLKQEDETKRPETRM